VVRALEPVHPLIDCASPLCPLLAPGCGLKTVLQEGMHNFIATLDNYTLADICPSELKNL